MNATRVLSGMMLVALALVAWTSTAAADPIAVGDCSKSGACVSVCLQGVASCPQADQLVCVGVSLQVPQCVRGGVAELPP